MKLHFFFPNIYFLLSSLMELLRNWNQNCYFLLHFTSIIFIFTTNSITKIYNTDPSSTLNHMYYFSTAQKPFFQHLICTHPEDSSCHCGHTVDDKFQEKQKQNLYSQRHGTRGRVFPLCFYCRVNTTSALTWALVTAWKAFWPCGRGGKPSKPNICVKTRLASSSVPGLVDIVNYSSRCLNCLPTFCKVLNHNWMIISHQEGCSPLSLI